MIVVRKFSEGGQRIEHLTLTASDGEDAQLLAALYQGYVKDRSIEIALRDGRRLKSNFTEKRRSTRISSRLPVLLCWQEGPDRLQEETVTTNLSRYGCAIYSRKFFQPKTLVQLQYKERSIDARTAYSLADYSSNLVEVGLDFGRDCVDFWELTSAQ